MTGIDIDIRNLLRIETANIRLQPGEITTVTGENAAGKTSIATLVASGLARDANPMGAGKGQGKLYLRDGTDAGQMDIKDENGVLISWDGGDGFTCLVNDPTRQSSSATVGLIDFTASAGPAARTAIWQEIFEPDPAAVKEMVLDMLKGVVSDSALSQIDDYLSDNASADDVARGYEERARNYKAQWQGVTGETWGAKKGADWQPTGWHSDLDGKDLDAIEERMNDAKADLQNMHIQHAIGVADVERAKDAAKRLPALEAAVAEAKAAQAEAEETSDLKYEEYQAAVKTFVSRTNELERLRKQKPDAAKGHLSCPHCGGAVVMGNGELVRPDTADAKAVYEQWVADGKAAADAVDAARELKDRLKAPTNELMDAVAAANATLMEARIALAKCKEEAVNADTTPTEGNADAVREAQSVVDASTEDFRLVKARTEAMTFHRNIVDYSAIAKVLGKQGVRAELIEGHISDCNKVLDRISQITGWPEVRIGPGYEVSIDRRTFLRACAESERLRAQYSIQIAIARAKREPVVILDGIDHLDSEQLPNLISLLMDICTRPEPPAFLLCGTDIDLEKLPGNKYVVTDGITTAV